MSSVGVLIEKKSKCPKKKNFQSVKKGGEKNISVEFRVFGKKNEVPGKKSKCLGVML